MSKEKDTVASNKKAKVDELKSAKNRLADNLTVIGRLQAIEEETQIVGG